MKLERRAVPLEVRAKDDGAPQIIGYPIRFDALSHPLGFPGMQFRERIAPDAEIEFIPDLVADFDHDSAYTLGRQSNNTLAISVDREGVRAIIDPPDTQWARDLMVQIRRGDIAGGSFAFSVMDGGDEWKRDKDGERTRTLNRIQVSRVSVVSDPAYPSTSIAVRSQFIEPGDVLQQHIAETGAARDAKPTERGIPLELLLAKNAHRNR
jgi:HK97 family phage prohead protease